LSLWVIWVLWDPCHLWVLYDPYDPYQPTANPSRDSAGFPRCRFQFQMSALFRPKLQPPAGLPRAGEAGSEASPRTSASDGTSPSGSPRLVCRGGLACEPQAPVGQADWGRPPQPPRACRVPLKQARKLAHEPLLQTGQARLGARASCCRKVAANLALQSGKPTGGDHRSPRRARPQCHLLSAPNRSGTARAVR
jgi:hypothetical protein